MQTISTGPNTIFSWMKTVELTLFMGRVNVSNIIILSMVNKWSFQNYAQKVKCDEMNEVMNMGNE